MELADHLREQLAEGATLEEAARLLGRSRSFLHRLAVAQAMPRRRRAMDDAVRSRIVAMLSDGRQSITSIARQCGVSKSTVSHIANAELRLRPGFKPRRIRRARTCPTCRRRVWLWPCVACHARESRTGASIA